ncbi:MAG: hypothetical protein AMS23_01385 [Bacteroides sp. SM1_62]|nr:MAG: hypothetical protein AMS23_01385 [Bacteroides sp. SM1_62]
MGTTKPKKSKGAEPDLYRILGQLFAVIFVFATLGSSNLSAQFKEESVQKAYELRMNGEIWYARAMLNKLNDLGLKDGMAHYELARVKMAQMLGGFDIQADGIINSARQAVKADSGNVAFAYTEASARFGKAYMSIMQEAESAKTHVDEAVMCFERVLELKPDYHEVRVLLVEIYHALPENMGGNKEKAAAHAQRLKEMDSFFSAQAWEIMRPEETSRLEYWQQVWKENQEDMRVQKQLGLAYLADGDLEEAEPIFKKVMKSDPTCNTLMLDIARHHMYQVMWDRSKAKVELPLAEAAIREYLSLEPEPIAPLKAWAIGNLAKFKYFSGEQEEGDRLMAVAKALDPAFSKASAVPGMELYIPPGEIYRSGEYSSFLRPF